MRRVGKRKVARGVDQCAVCSTLNLKILFSVTRPSMFANWCPWKLDSYPPAETRRWCAIFHDQISQGWFPGPKERLF